MYSIKEILNINLYLNDEVIARSTKKVNKFKFNGFRDC